MGKHIETGRLGGKHGLFLRAFIAVLIVGGIALSSLVVVVSLSPVTGTAGADFLRGIFGPQLVADMEAVVFTAQDIIHHTIFVLGGSQASAPWETPTPGSLAPTTTSVVNKSAEESLANTTPTPTPLPNQLVSPTPTAILPPIAAPWQLPNLTPIGNLAGEGVWQAWIQDSSGSTIAYRTFLAPDTTRPYAVVAVVALDLTKVQLHYQLGTQEPVSPGRAPGTGKIPDNYLQPGVLLAAFNGGFKTVNGHYGVIIDGQTLVPMIDGLGTLAIYQDGHLSMGVWGADLTLSPDMVVVRQNCPIIIDQGQINPQVYQNSVYLWGGTVKGNIVTFRSGIGLSRDGKTLYYFAGNYLSTQTLAMAMQATGVYEAMQMDINNYYVLFTKFSTQNGQLSSVALLPKEMVDNIGRFLGSYTRDFFYITSK